MPRFTPVLKGKLTDGGAKVLSGLISKPAPVLSRDNLATKGFLKSAIKFGSTLCWQFEARKAIIAVIKKIAALNITIDDLVTGN